MGEACVADLCNDGTPTTAPLLPLCCLLLLLLLLLLLASRGASEPRARTRRGRCAMGVCGGVRPDQLLANDQQHAVTASSSAEDRAPPEADRLMKRRLSIGLRDSRSAWSPSYCMNIHDSRLPRFPPYPLARRRNEQPVDVTEAAVVRRGERSRKSRI